MSPFIYVLITSLGIQVLQIILYLCLQLAQIDWHKKRKLSVQKRSNDKSELYPNVNLLEPEKNAAICILILTIS